MFFHLYFLCLYLFTRVLTIYAVYLQFTMPVNLNALIRYKTIDECLSNPNLKCTIDLLINKVITKKVIVINDHKSAGFRAYYGDLLKNKDLL